MTVLPHSRSDRTAAAILAAAAHVLAARSSASMADVAAAAGVGRATLYRYYESRESLLDALAEKAVADAGARLADAGLDRVPVEEAIERIVRAVIAVGDNYAVLVHERIEADRAEAERTLGGPIRAVLARGIESGALRDDLPVEILTTFFGSLLTTAITLVSQRQIGLEDASAATAGMFLRGARTA